MKVEKVEEESDGESAFVVKVAEEFSSIAGVASDPLVKRFV